MPAFRRHPLLGPEINGVGQFNWPRTPPRDPDTLLISVLSKAAIRDRPLRVGGLNLPLDPQVTWEGRQSGRRDLLCACSPRPSPSQVTNCLVNQAGADNIRVLASGREETTTSSLVDDFGIEHARIILYPTDELLSDELSLWKKACIELE